MIVERVYDPEVIKSVLLRPEIVATIAEDGIDPTRFEPDLRECWLGMYTDELVGLYRVHALNSVTVQIHAHVLPEHRKAHSLDTGRAALRWIHDHTPYAKVVCEIPEVYPNVKDFAVKNGFRVEGLNRASYRKGGKVIDQWYLGITRDEIAEQMNVESS